MHREVIYIEYDKLGFLIVQAVTANGALPVPDATVHIYEYAEDFDTERTDILYSLRTDASGRTEKIALDAKDKERIVRALSRNAAQVTPDSQGRVVLTPDLIKFAEIDKNAYIIGCGHYSEIWSEANYEAMVAEEDLASMRELLESYGL